MHINKFYNLDISPNINRVINSNRITEMMYEKQKKFIQTFSHKTWSKEVAWKDLLLQEDYT